MNHSRNFYSSHIYKTSLFLLFAGAVFAWMCMSCTSGKVSKSPSGSFTLLLTVKGTEDPASMLKVVYPESSIEPDKNGTITVQIFTGKPAFATIEFNDDQYVIFGSPGDSLILVGDAGHIFTKPDFTGDKSSENNFLVLAKQKEVEWSESYQDLMTMPEADFLKSVEQWYQNQLNDFRDYQKSYGIFSQEFADLYLTELKYRQVNLKMDYPAEYAYFTKTDSFIPSETYYSFFQNLNTDADEKLSAPSYREFLPKFLEYKTGELIRSDTVLKSEAPALLSMKNVSRVFQNSEVQSFVYYSLMERFFEQSFNDAFSTYDFYLENQKNPELKEQIRQKYKKMKHLKPGSSIPDITLMNDKNQTVELSGMKNKVLYLDIWASWCGPCKREFPYFEKVVQHYRERNDVFFAGISLDDDKETWLQYVRAKNMSYPQLFEEKNWEAAWVKHFNIEFIPRFILIDKNGRIANAHAPRPSDPNIYKEIDKLLTEE